MKNISKYSVYIKSLLYICSVERDQQKFFESLDNSFLYINFIYNLNFSFMETTNLVNNEIELVNEKNQVENSKMLNEKLANKKKFVKVETSKNVVTTKNGKVETKNVSKQAEKLSFSALQNSLDLSSLGSNSGLKKENLYNNTIYADCVCDKDKKSVRRKIRAMLDNFLGSIIKSEKNPAICKQQVKQFIIFYENVYKVNDFSLSSLVSNNTDELKKRNLLKMLELVKKYK